MLSSMQIGLFVGINADLDAEIDINADCDADLGLDADSDGRWMGYKDVVSFGSLPQSFALMCDAIMLGCWTIFSDAATDIGNWYVSTIFFYSFKVRSGRDSFAVIVNRSIGITDTRSQCKNRDT